MDFLGMGPLEILLILILGFLFFGPEKLPSMAAKAGKLYRNFRKATFDLSKTITEDLKEEGDIIKEDLSAIGKTITEDLKEESDIIKEDLSAIGKTINEDLSPEDKAKKNSTTTAASESTEASKPETAQDSAPTPDEEII